MAWRSNSEHSRKPKLIMITLSLILAAGLAAAQIVPRPGPEYVGQFLSPLREAARGIMNGDRVLQGLGEQEISSLLESVKKRLKESPRLSGSRLAIPMKATVADAISAQMGVAALKARYDVDNDQELRFLSRFEIDGQAYTAPEEGDFSGMIIKWEGDQPVVQAIPKIFAYDGTPISDQIAALYKIWKRNGIFNPPVKAFKNIKFNIDGVSKSLDKLQVEDLRKIIVPIVSTKPQQDSMLTQSIGTGVLNAPVRLSLDRATIEQIAQSFLIRLFTQPDYNLNLASIENAKKSILSSNSKKLTSWAITHGGKVPDIGSKDEPEYELARTILFAGGVQNVQGKIGIANGGTEKKPTLVATDPNLLPPEISGLSKQYANMLAVLQARRKKYQQSERTPIGFRNLVELISVSHTWPLETQDYRVEMMRILNLDGRATKLRPTDVGVMVERANKWIGVGRGRDLVEKRKVAAEILRAFFTEELKRNGFASTASKETDADCGGQIIGATQNSKGRQVPLQ